MPVPRGDRKGTPLPKMPKVLVDSVINCPKSKIHPLQFVEIARLRFALAQPIKLECKPFAVELTVRFVYKETMITIRCRMEHAGEVERKVGQTVGLLLTKRAVSLLLPNLHAEANWDQYIYLGRS